MTTTPMLMSVSAGAGNAFGGHEEKKQAKKKTNK
jgi:hypothetical protein